MSPDTTTTTSAFSVNLPASSIHDILLESAKANPAGIAIEFKDREIRYGEAAVCARRIGSALRSLGVRPGDRVGVMLPNLPEFLIAYYGALMAGATLVLYNVMLTPAEIEYLANDSGTKMLFVHADLLPKVEEAAKNIPTLKGKIVIGDAASDTGGDRISYNQLLHDGEPDFEPHKPAVEDLALLVYTSGTTGKPKGAMLSHFNVLANLSSIHQMRPPVPGTKMLCVLPLFHCFGLIALLNLSVLRGNTLFLHPRFEADAVVDALKTKGITHFSGTPTMYFHILKHPEAQEGATFPHLQRCGSGGAPLPVEVRRMFDKRFGVDITEGYGLSETTVSACGYHDGTPIKAGSVGLPIPGVDLKIVDEEGTEQMFHDMGEILLRGPNITRGYWNKPEATAGALKDGWLYTGDLGYVDNQGYVFIVDRKKDMILKGGYNIYPREIEEVIYEFPEVDMAAVIGVPDEAKGESVQALVSLKPDHELTTETIEERLREKLSKYKLPERVIIIDEIPTGPTGKILKRELRDRWEEIKGAQG